jgi:hypothetical protein
MNSPNQTAASSVHPIAVAVELNDGIEETVKQSADELLLVNAVLQSHVPGKAKSEDVAMAIEKVEDIKDTVAASAKDLAVVNQLLEDEIDERILLERKLKVTEAALKRATT